MKIAIIDDQQDIRYSLSKILQRHNHKTVQFTGLEFDITNSIEEQNIDLLIVDVMLTDTLTGIDLIKSFKKKGLNLPIILMTAYTTPENMIEASKIGIKDILQKPFDESQLMEIVNKFVTVPSQKEVLSVGLHVEQKNEFVGSFETMKEIYHKIGIAANNNLAVLIYGQTGTGKELIASLIHKNSDRPNEPFIAINCASIPKELFESQLFGHEKGSFTSAEKQHIGYAEQAKGGTLFLDEIGELDSQLQSKLLRFLETKQFRRVGGNKEIGFEGRIISATNVDLKEKSRSGAFREDLYFRLSILSITMPTLAQRIQDIPILCEYFINKANKELQTKITGISREACNAIKKQPWEGNIRELRNVIYSACLNARDTILTKEDMRLNSLDNTNNTDEKLQKIIKTLLLQNDIMQAGEMKAKFDAIFLSTCFKLCPNISQLAAALQIARNTLKKQLTHFKIK
ncbi:MAG: sigma-54-dependent Fis family transcriptional regulator [Sulfurospirillum sp.]|nr:sigma-54-dependent Fis family transcriptional regulator [Sulfurospirillum sp.]